MKLICESSLYVIFQVHGVNSRDSASAKSVIIVSIPRKPLYPSESSVCQLLMSDTRQLMSRYLRSIQ